MLPTRRKAQWDVSCPPLRVGPSFMGQGGEAITVIMWAIGHC